MSDKSISEAKFKLQELLMDKLGLGAAALVEAIDQAKDKAALGDAVAKAAAGLQASKKADAAKALSNAWMMMRNRL